MAVVFSKDNTDTGWSTEGSPILIDDLWNPLACHDYNDVDQLAFRTDHGLVGTETEFSFDCWVKGTPDGGTTFPISLGDEDNANGWIANINYQGGGNFLLAFYSTTTNNFVFSTVSSGNAFDGNWRHIIGSVIATGSGNADVDAFIDGVEPSYSAQNVKGGTGFVAASGALEASTAICYGARYGSTASGGFAGGIVTRGRIRNTKTTSVQAAARYAAEVAAQGEGFSTATTNPLFPDASMFPDGSLFPDASLFPDGSLYPR